MSPTGRRGLEGACEDKPLGGGLASLRIISVSRRAAGEEGLRGGIKRRAKEMTGLTRKAVILAAFVFSLVVAVAIPHSVESADPASKPVTGRTGVSSRWGSGWLDLDTAMDFLKGDRLRLTLGGTAAKIFVRLLPRGESPDESVWIIGGAITVPQSRIVEVTLPADRKQIIQISVHGGPSPWNRGLGGGNGPATVEAVELIRR